MAASPDSIMGATDVPELETVGEAEGALPPAYGAGDSKVFLGEWATTPQQDGWHSLWPNCPVPIKVDFSDVDVRAASEEAYAYAYALPLLPVPMIPPNLFLLLRGALDPEAACLPVVSMHEVLVMYQLVLRLAVRGHPLRPTPDAPVHTVKGIKEHKQEMLEAAQLAAARAMEVLAALDSQLLQAMDDFTAHMQTLVERMRTAYAQEPASDSVSVRDQDVTVELLTARMLKVSLADPLTQTEKGLAAALCAKTYMAAMNVVCIAEGAVAHFLGMPDAVCPHLLVGAIKQSSAVFSDTRKLEPFGPEVLASMRRQEHDFLRSIEGQYGSAAERRHAEDLAPEDGGQEEADDIVPIDEERVDMHSGEQAQWPRDLLRGCASSHAYLHMLRYMEHQMKGQERKEAKARGEVVEPAVAREPTPAEEQADMVARKLHRERRVQLAEHCQRMEAELADERVALDRISQLGEAARARTVDTLIAIGPQEVERRAKLIVAQTREVLLSMREDGLPPPSDEEVMRQATIEVVEEIGRGVAAELRGARQADTLASDGPPAHQSAEEATAVLADADMGVSAGAGADLLQPRD
jgi:hypothetical protein